MTLQWRHNERDGISNHQPYDCLLNRLSRRWSKKTSKLRVTGLCAGNSPGTGELPAQRASNAENVSIWWRHHDILSVGDSAQGYQISANSGYIFNTHCSQTLWRHQMEIFSALLALCAGNSPVTGELPSQWPVTQSFDVFFHLCLNKRLSKQSWGWSFETQSRLLWRHCNVSIHKGCLWWWDVWDEEGWGGLGDAGCRSCGIKYS